MNEKAFAKETDLCAAFLAKLPDTWTAYPETGGFDILLVRKADGFQIGVEAKLKLNAKVICQAAEDGKHWHVAGPNPDCRAVLIPEGVSLDMAPICALLGITVVRMRAPNPDEDSWRHQFFSPDLPRPDYEWGGDRWYERAPAERVALPDWIPDVVAGDKAPVALTPWKVKAIKLVVVLEKRGYLTRQDFKHFQVSMSRWSDPYARWLIKDGKGGWTAGPYLPDFRAQHPVNFGQIEADYDKWKQQPNETAPLL